MGETEIPKASLGLGLGVWGFRVWVRGSIKVLLGL